MPNATSSLLLLSLKKPTDIMEDRSVWRLGMISTSSRQAMGWLFCQGCCFHAVSGVAVVCGGGGVVGRMQCIL